MRANRPPLSTVLLGLLAISFVVLPTGASAQTQAYGSCWIESGNPDGILLHADGDSLCTLDFPADCYGGMMAPDSLYCTLEDVPEASLPEGVVHGVDCWVEDDTGTGMMGGGHHMGMDFFRNPVEVTVDYDPATVAARGMDPQDLVLVTRSADGLQIMGGAVHHMADHCFTVAVDELADWYGVADGSSVLVAADDGSWGDLKARY